MTDSTQTDDPLSRREVQHSDREVRHVRNPDGTLYAYREDGEHVVVSQGNEPATQWTKRVPAERTAVIAGQQLWTIPDNWELRANIDGAAERYYAIYHIPETGVDVLVQVPRKNHLVDKWYSIKRVGQIEVTYDDSFNWDELEKAIDHTREEEDVSAMVPEALEILNQCRDAVEADFIKRVEMHAEEAVFEHSRDMTPTINDWTLEPWRDNFDIQPTLERVLEVPDDRLDLILQELEHITLHPHYPTVRVDVAEGEGIPDQFELRALTQAGCSPAEAHDYLMVELTGLTQTEWADERGKKQPSISGNIRSAKQKLKA